MREFKMCKLKKGVLPGLVLALGLAVTSAAADETAEFQRQEALALEYRWKIDRTSDPAAREALYLRLIEECPETEAAERAHWTLSNLYLDDFEDPREDDARKILERFVKRYPSSRWLLHVTDRLAWFWGDKRP